MDKLSMKQSHEYDYYYVLCYCKALNKATNIIIAMICVFKLLIMNVCSWLPSVSFLSWPIALRAPEKAASMSKALPSTAEPMLLTTKFTTKSLQHCCPLKAQTGRDEPTQFEIQSCFVVVYCHATLSKTIAIRSSLAT